MSRWEVLATTHGCKDTDSARMGKPNVKEQVSTSSDHTGHHAHHDNKGDEALMRRMIAIVFLLKSARTSWYSGKCDHTSKIEILID